MCFLFLEVRAGDAFIGIWERERVGAGAGAARPGAGAARASARAGEPLELEEWSSDIGGYFKNLFAADGVFGLAVDGGHAAAATS